MTLRFEQSHVLSRALLADRAGMVEVEGTTFQICGAPEAVGPISASDEQVRLFPIEPSTDLVDMMGAFAGRIPASWQVFILGRGDASGPGSPLWAAVSPGPLLSRLMQLYDPLRSCRGLIPFYENVLERLQPVAHEDGDVQFSAAEDGHPARMDEASYWNAFLSGYRQWREGGSRHRNAYFLRLRDTLTNDCFDPGLLREMLDHEKLWQRCQLRFADCGRVVCGEATELAPIRLYLPPDAALARIEACLERPVAFGDYRIDGYHRLFSLALCGYPPSPLFVGLRKPEPAPLQRTAEAAP